MTSYWFTADSHFGHDRIRKYTNRPFDTVDEMNETIIRNWNERVKKTDQVLFLGDFCFKEKNGINADYWRRQLNGDIIFIKGNHDNNNGLKTCIDSMVITLGGKTWWCEHHPYGSTMEYNLIAHVHDKWQIDMPGNQIYYNVGVDVNKFHPVTIQEIMRNISKAKRNKIERVTNVEKKGLIPIEKSVELVDN